MYCQVVYICGLIPARIRQALAELPETLDETYQRTLREINKAEWEFAHRMFQFIAVASRPLFVEELAELVAFDFAAGPIPKFHEGWRLEDPVDAVLSTCSTLLAIVDGGCVSNHRYVNGKIIEFSHFSVKEFLTSARLASDIITCRYHISMTPAHTLAARACLGILLHLDEDVATSDSLDKWPLAEYAAEHWVDHARLEDVSRNVEDVMKQLFDPIKPHLAVCIWIHDPDSWTAGCPERPLPLAKTLLHYAALWGLFSLVEFLVTEHLQNVHSQDSFDNATPLHLAARMGHAKVSRFLLERDADVTAQDGNGSTPLHQASQYGNAETASMLIERGADVTAQDKNGSTPLHLASQFVQAEIASMLIERGADVTAQDENGSTPLHQASKLGQAEMASMLIERGADVTAQDEGGSTPLHLASQFGQAETASMLIERGADVTAQDENGWTPLHQASQYGNAEIASMLIERGADVTAQDENGSTPLHQASEYRYAEIASILIERGADVTARDENRSTPLHLVSAYGNAEIASMLIERDADVTAQDEKGRTPLHLASNIEVAGMLIEHGADVTAQDKCKSTPLHMASKWGEVGVASMLLERGADVTAQNKDGSTPLHLASTPSEWLPPFLTQGRLVTTRILLERGADVTAQDKDGRTPLDLASSHQDLAEVVQVLLHHGAKSDDSDPGTHDNKN